MKGIQDKNKSAQNETTKERLYFIARRGKEIELDESTIDMYM
jgi:hypothetical protein